ncbi:MAG TPA: hypothetical protein VGZ27_05945 [Vicinamibacterales bacterium]|jgi:hypothetical protein|nr:hypothetical protein [Vicinamibacterales bacterium]
MSDRGRLATAIPHSSDSFSETLAPVLSAPEEQEALAVFLKQEMPASERF